MRKTTVVSAAAAVALAFGAQAQDKPKPPPIWKQGMPEKMKDSTLAPHAGKMTETPASDIDTSALKVCPRPS